MQEVRAMPKTYLDSILGDREKIIRISRQHWFLLFNTIFLEIVLILIIIAVSVALKTTIGSAAPGADPFIIAIGILALLFPLATMIRDILIWSNHMFIVTNRRIMQITGIFNKNVIDSSLEKVNDVKMQQSALGRLFNFGDIEILTASEFGTNLFRKIADPVGFKTDMLNAKEQLDHDLDSPEVLDLGAESGGMKSTSSPSSGVDVPALITQLAQLRQQGILTEDEFMTKKADLLKKM